ncbi:MAG: UDP-4-amino-4,6-dideoxy-N-acetyl-beta-L-altrosamine transaminase, partial [Verrucomicrobiota bacterium]
RQSINQSDIEAVTEVLRSDWLTQGPTVRKFESAIADYCGCDHAIAFSSASAALHAGCHALGLGEGDRFATSNITFAASANCGLHCGAKLDLCDVDPRNGLMDLEKLETTCCQSGPPKLVIPVYLAGNSVDQVALKKLSEKYGFRILEDASHALGARYQNTRIGSCNHSDAAVFSLHPVKMITSGEGGLLVTNNSDVAARARKFREHGISREPKEWRNNTETTGSWYYEVQELGFNYRLSEIHAALGLSQLGRLDSFVRKRRAIHNYYSKHLAPESWTVVSDAQDCASSWHLCVAQLPEESTPESYHAMFTALRAKGLYVNLHYIPLNRHPLYEGLNQTGHYPGSDSWARRAISIPCHAELSDDDLEHTTQILNETAKRFLQTQ